jgi:multiple sugar transport system substrate-binding protein
MISYRLWFDVVIKGDIIVRTLSRSVAFLLLLGMIGLSVAVRPTQAHTAKAQITITVAYQKFPPPPYWDEQFWLRVKQQLATTDPNINLKLDPIVADEGDYYTKIDLLMRSASTAPDIIREDSFLVGSDVTAGYLTPLDSYLATWPEYKQEWFSNMQQITTFNGHNYGIMNGTDDRMIYYNKDVFKKAGLPTNWQPHSWADILSAAQTIKNKEPNVIPMNCYTGVINDEASTMQCFEMLLYGTPGKPPLYDYATKKWVASSKGMLDTLNFIKKVYDPSDLLGPPNDIALNDQGANIIHNQLFPQDKIGIDLDGSWIDNSWVPGGAAPWPNWQKVVGVAKTPTEFGQAPGYVTMSGGWAYSISAKSAHKDAAFEVLKVANSAANLAWYDVKVGNITPRKDVVDDPSYAKVPLNSFFTGLLSFTQFRPGYPAYPRISNAIDSAMESVMSGISPKDALANFQAAVTGIAGPNNVEIH